MDRRCGAMRRIREVIEYATLERIHRRLAKALAPPARHYRPLHVEGHVAGWLTEERTTRIAAFGKVFSVDSEGIHFVPALADARSRSHALAPVAARLAAEGALTAWRDERYAVAPQFGAPPWFVLERAAARYFGVHTWAAHVNGLTRDGDRESMWLARRSPGKAIDPGMLDNLVGGGIAAGASVGDTVVKEAWEEAGIPALLAREAQPAGAVHIRRDQSDGLHWETIFVHDLWLPAAFVPANQDGEAVGHRLAEFRDAAQMIAQASGPDEVTVDASLVILDCLWRRGAIAADAPDYRGLEALRAHDAAGFAGQGIRGEPKAALG